jgi:hypothetical protein
MRKGLAYAAIIVLRGMAFLGLGGMIRGPHDSSWEVLLDSCFTALCWQWANYVERCYRVAFEPKWIIDLERKRWGTTEYDRRPE